MLGLYDDVVAPLYSAKTLFADGYAEIVSIRRLINTHTHQTHGNTGESYNAFGAIDKIYRRIEKKQ